MLEYYKHNRREAKYGVKAPVIVNAEFVSKELVDKSSPKKTKMGFCLEA